MLLNKSCFSLCISFTGFEFHNKGRKTYNSNCSAMQAFVGWYSFMDTAISRIYVKTWKARMCEVKRAVSQRQLAKPSKTRNHFLKRLHRHLWPLDWDIRLRNRRMSVIRRRLWALGNVIQITAHYAVTVCPFLFMRDFSVYANGIKRLTSNR